MSQLGGLELALRGVESQWLNHSATGANIKEITASVPSTRNPPGGLSGVDGEAGDELELREVLVVVGGAEPGLEDAARQVSGQY